MTARHDPILTSLLTALCTAGLMLGCSSGAGGGGGTGENAAAGQSSNGNGSGSATDDAGTTGASAAHGPLCLPSSAQTSACNGMPAGASCTLTRSTGDGDMDADDDGGVLTIAGTCRATVDGTVGCFPNPPAPPAVLTDPCSGKSAGASCTIQGPFGTFQGTCFDFHATTTLICGRVRTPPQPFVDACTGKTAGDGCTIAKHHDAGVISGVCGNGPTGQGPLACGPSHDRTDRREARLEAACDGLDAGTTCALGKGFWSVGGTCTTPAGGGAALCLAPCPELRHKFPFGGHDPRMPWEPPVPMIPHDGGTW